MDDFENELWLILLAICAEFVFELNDRRVTYSHFKVNVDILGVTFSQFKVEILGSVCTLLKRTNGWFCEPVGLCIELFRIFGITNALKFIPTN